MELPKNRFKAAIKAGRHQLGIWNTIGGNTVPEILAGAGFDWILLDTEHSPVEAYQILPALQAVSGFPEVSAVVRPVTNDAALIKRYLDMGAQTILIPYVQSAAEARAAVDAMRYPPTGIRGVAGLTRAGGYGRIKGYAARAHEELCLIVQVETREALDRLEEIATVDGVDGVFIGPSDLAASLGHPGDIAHPEVVAAMEGAYARLAKLGVPSGTLAVNPDTGARAIELGTAFTAVGMDMAILMTGLAALRARFA